MIAAFTRDSAVTSVLQNVRVWREVIAAFTNTLLPSKRFDWTSELGKFLDPAADKLLLVSIFVCATWLGLVPRWLTAAAVARDALIALGALVYRLWFGPLYGRPMFSSKLNTGLQLAYLLSVMAAAAFRVPGQGWLATLAVLTLLTTVVSGAGYVIVFTRRALALPARPS